MVITVDFVVAAESVVVDFVVFVVFEAVEFELSLVMIVLDVAVFAVDGLV